MGPHPDNRSGSGARWGRAALLALLALSATCLLALAGDAGARMVSHKLGPTLCETTGGGRFVAIPGFPGERIDRRLLRDIRWIEKRYPIFITDGYSRDPVHSQNGEHPIGLALDIVPNRAEGGTWSDIDRLARWAEPRQNRPRAPFRWVGYDGDAGHGRGNHLHLSWSHSETRPGRPAKLVETIRCPGSAGGGQTQPTEPTDPTEPTEPTQPTGPTTGGTSNTSSRGGGGGGRHRGHRGHHRGHRGHRGRDTGSHGGHGTGGVGRAQLKLARPVPETGGVGVRR